MKKYLLQMVLLCIIVATCASVYAQGDPNATRPSNESPPIEYPETGIRFVICTTTKERLPMPLYAEYKGDYVPLYISARGTSERAVAKNGHVVLYENQPSKDEKGAAKEEERKPFLDIPVPAVIGNSKAICLVILTGKNAKPVYYFMKESDFPMGGIYVVNFSTSKLVFYYTFTREFNVSEGHPVAPFKRPENNCLRPDGENIYAVMLKEHPGAKNIDFVLHVPAEGEGGTPMPLRNARLPIRSYSSTIMLVVRNPQDQSYKVISITYNDTLEKRQKFYRENVMKDTKK